ncbi:polysialyltransferase family glycosyltransferase [Saccharospirillum salsuginis]|uniref:Uncharacterized protein n=1 Tax=Saccharospirillum salsuginis TaxID=418750 RepID=A0A918KEF8_9GAMM|nr:polysialyltransferase family glycosyltransferase [Saccharospirillum salsuginis]GGX60345.1 hypothetical protein GCM10007392_30460 [Saccharospirillum salsuginis]
MKRILIYINDSLGELDWITPFLLSDEASKYKFFIYFNNVGSDLEAKKRIYSEYSLTRDNITLLNSKENHFPKLSKIDDFVNRALNKIKGINYHLFEWSRNGMDFLRVFVAKFIPNSYRFDVIFRDYNLKDSFALRILAKNSSNAKFVIFPHAVGIQRVIPGHTREPIKSTKVDLWLENTEISDYAAEKYSNQLFVSGAPVLSDNFKKESMFDPESSRILILTRICSPEYGFTLEDSLSVYSDILSWCSGNSFNVMVKHHPRDKNLKVWRKIQERFSNVEEYTDSLMNLSDKFSACLSFFSTAGLFLTSRRVPVFDISPYEELKEAVSYPFHFNGEDGRLTHDLVEQGCFSRLENYDKIKDISFLSDSSRRQYNCCKQLFPEEAHKRIQLKLDEVLD